MKKVAKKGWCITAAVMAVSVIVCIFCFVRWERKSSDLSFQFEETTYTYEDEYYDVDKLVYLQMVGSRDKEKERKINQLLEDDRKKVMEMEPPDLYPDDGWEYGFHGLRHHSPPPVLSLACDTILNIPQEVFLFYPHRFQLFHSPQHSWGIRLFI